MKKKLYNKKKQIIKSALKQLTINTKKRTKQNSRLLILEK